MPQMATGAVMAELYQPPKSRLIVEDACCGKGKERWEPVIKEIAVTGYPKSGNTWLSWLLGDVLDSPVGGLYYAKPLCTEGQDRLGDHKIMQLHLRPVYEIAESVIPSAWSFCVPLWKGNPPIVHIVRDPRDVVVSVWKYWNIESLDQALGCVGQGLGPVKVHLPWQDHVGRWLKIDGISFVRYEDLHERGPEVIAKLLDGWGIEYNPDRIKIAFRRQHIGRKRAQIKKDHLTRVYNEGIQLHNLRKGIAGDWKNHFTDEQHERAVGYFGEVAERVGYEL